MLLASFQTWRSLPSAILPLAFLQAFALGLVELPAMYLFRDIECEAYKTHAPPHLPEDDVCRSAAVQRAYTADSAVYLAILTITSIIVSGPYGRVSDMRSRKLVMGAGAFLNAVGDLWLCLSGIIRFTKIYPAYSH